MLLLIANVYPLLQYHTTTINLPVMCTFQVSPWSEEFRAIQLRRLTHQRFQSCKFENSGDLIILWQSRYPFKPTKWKINCFRKKRWFYINNNKPKLFCLCLTVDIYLFCLFLRYYNFTKLLLLHNYTEVCNCTLYQEYYCWLIVKNQLVRRTTVATTREWRYGYMKLRTTGL